MRLVWKLLRQHISLPQFIGFFFANLVGMLIVLLGIQFYHDYQAVSLSEDSFMKEEYVIINKKVDNLSMITDFTGFSNATFSQGEIDELKRQHFVERVGAFTSSAYSVVAYFDVEKFAKFSTDMFFESVPDEFVDVATEKWTFAPGDTLVPIILPKNYLDLYNFGFAQSRNMPKVSEGLMGSVSLGIRIRGNGYDDRFTGKIVGFSTRLNTILVPDAFMEWANGQYASPDRAGVVSRIIMQVPNPTDKELSAYIQKHRYETDQAKLDASKTTFILRLIVGIVMIIGLIISALSFYILMLSIYLLVQKNTTKLENLLLIGYSPAKVALPYQLLTIGLNLLVLILALVVLAVARNYYMDLFKDMFPSMEVPSIMPAVWVGLAIFAIVSLLNVVAVKRKIMAIWKRKD